MYVDHDGGVASDAAVVEGAIVPKSREDSIAFISRQVHLPMSTISDSFNVFTHLIKSDATHSDVWAHQKVRACKIRSAFFDLELLRAEIGNQFSPGLWGMQTQPPTPLPIAHDLQRVVALSGAQQAANADLRGACLLQQFNRMVATLHVQALQVHGPLRREWRHWRACTFADRQTDGVDRMFYVAGCAGRHEEGSRCRRQSRIL